jgi:hypothetical protein
MLSLRTVLAAGLIASVPLALTGCAQTLLETGIFDGDSTNLLETSYGAADLLAHQAKGTLKPGAPVHTGILTNLYPQTSSSKPGTPSGTPVMTSPPPPAPFGKVITGQVAARLQQLGFNVIGDGGAATGPGDAVLTGQYARANGKVLINLRMLDSNSGRVLAAYDYTLPVTGEISDLLGTDGRSGWFDL